MSDTKWWNLTTKEVVAKLFVECNQDGFRKLTNLQCKQKLENWSWYKYPEERTGFLGFGGDANQEDREKFVLDIKTEFCKTYPEDYFCPEFKAPVKTTVTSRPRNTTRSQGASQGASQSNLNPNAHQRMVSSTGVPEGTPEQSFVAANMTLLIAAGLVGCLICLCVIGVAMCLKKKTNSTGKGEGSTTGSVSKSKSTAGSASKSKASSVAKSTAKSKVGTSKMAKSKVAKAATVKPG